MQAAQLRRVAMSGCAVCDFLESMLKSDRRGKARAESEVGSRRQNG